MRPVQIGDSLMVVKALVYTYLGSDFWLVDDGSIHHYRMVYMETLLKSGDACVLL